MLLMEFEEAVLAEMLRDRLEKVFKAEVSVEVKRLENVESSYDGKRRQYNAVRLLEDLGPVDTYTLILTDRDLYVPGLNYVFGYAPGMKGLVSVYRLKPPKLFYDENLYFLRVVKECLHEVGHMLGLLHCKSPGCVMNFSNNVFEVDLKSDSFCSKCLSKLST
ncbi:MAG: archaemetzincin family Zn-dependent metalloprotease [Candidatus Caldarchaeum sp.]|nr:archaemetzincin family Zn-dependent metalloprotease [Candidatus Caldarchaeum sp.]